jgi:hypothetical protein
MVIYEIMIQDFKFFTYNKTSTSKRSTFRLVEACSNEKDN